MSAITFLTKDLPSKGVFYPNVDKIMLKRFSCGDIANLGSEDRGILELIADFKRDVSGIEPDKVLYMDFLYMLIHRTGSIYQNSKLTLDINCPECGEEISVDIDYTKIELADDINTYLDVFPVEVQIGDTYYDFNLPTIATIEALVKTQRSKSGHETYIRLKKETELTEDDRFLLKALEQKEIELLKTDSLLLLENSMRLITYGLLSSKDTLNTVNAIKKVDDAETLEILSFVDDVVSKTFKPYSTLCSKCEKNFKLSLEGLVVLLRPFRTSKQAIANKLRARKKM